ncbi:MAG TPA: nitrous oxide reductase accessory protein NosL [Usitatibacter sp.]|nr:nitrous oxide reductase accessory protein NosL [Usitatibacter sp.]
MNIPSKFRRAALVGALALFAACAQQAVVPPALELGAGALCSMDGMLLADFPGPKGQILYDQGAPDVFCDTYELLNALIAPEQQRRVAAAYTQDMAHTSWDKPAGHWIEARTAFYVAGSKRMGSMGPTLASFAEERDAEAFARENGGRVLRFSDITPDMVALDGGVLKDGLTR